MNTIFYEPARKKARDSAEAAPRGVEENVLHETAVDEAVMLAYAVLNAQRLFNA